MTDYAVMVMGHMAHRHGELQTTSDVVLSTGLPVPTVGKLLHRLAELELLMAIRGRNGGYRMDRLTTDISVAEIIAGFEGPVALTDCLPAGGGLCDFEDRCQVGGRWTTVAEAVQRVLDDLTLADMLGRAPRGVGGPVDTSGRVPIPGPIGFGP
ncbi:MAG: Rrf2 family transcriptional regulator [Alphaproteobacteria bacterium]|nr:Rrf2 family transcriptional regulator [Alphaproteobacteria bacterium]MCY4497850.1 Rrf2 family transcriptional regulator [Rhodospirillaceae bacterium]